LPAGAARRAAKPRGDHGYLSIDHQGNASQHRWWELSGSPAALIAFVRAHAPAGAAQTEIGSEQNLRRDTSAQTLGYQWPAVRGVLGLRELQLTATALSDGKTGVLAQSFSGWIRPRPSSEQIPASTDEVTITIGRPRQPATESLAATNGSQVRRIVMVIDRLSIVQGGARSCALETDPRIVTMTFDTASQAKPAAVLTYVDYRLWSDPSNACKPVALTIGGRVQDPLIGGRFLQTIGRVLGRSLI
jgi:hypothetical protein